MSRTRWSGIIRMYIYCRSSSFPFGMLKHRLNGLICCMISYQALSEWSTMYARMYPYGGAAYCY